METPPQNPPPNELAPISPSVSADTYRRLRLEQNLALAIFAGFAAAIVGALLWAAITLFTQYQIGWMAIGVGFLVGFAVRLGKGIDKIFGIIGAVFALIGCVLGNFFSLVGFISKQENLNIMSTLGAIDYSKVPNIMASTFSAMDLLFYGIAVYEGYRFSFRPLTVETAPAEAPPNP